MNLGPLGDSTIAIAQQWLQGLARRQDAISSNIANIDTPGYRAQDVPFEAELARAIGSSGAKLTTTDPRHIASVPGTPAGVGMQAAQELTSSRLDGNDVDIDQQMVLLSETQMRYQAAAQAITNRYETTRTALRTS